MGIRDILLAGKGAPALPSPQKEREDNSSRIFSDLRQEMKRLTDVISFQKKPEKEKKGATEGQRIELRNYATLKEINKNSEIIARNTQTLISLFKDFTTIQQTKVVRPPTVVRQFSQDTSSLSYKERQLQNREKELADKQRELRGMKDERFRGNTSLGMGMLGMGPIGEAFSGLHKFFTNRRDENEKMADTTTAITSLENRVKELIDLTKLKREDDNRNSQKLQEKMDRQDLNMDDLADSLRDKKEAPEEKKEEKGFLSTLMGSLGGLGNMLGLGGGIAGFTTALTNALPTLLTIGGLAVTVGLTAAKLKEIYDELADIHKNDIERAKRDAEADEAYSKKNRDLIAKVQAGQMSSADAIAQASKTQAMREAMVREAQDDLTINFVNTIKAIVPTSIEQLMDNFKESFNWVIDNPLKATGMSVGFAAITGAMVMGAGGITAAASSGALSIALGLTAMAGRFTRAALPIITSMGTAAAGIAKAAAPFALLAAEVYVVYNKYKDLLGMSSGLEKDALTQEGNETEVERTGYFVEQKKHEKRKELREKGYTNEQIKLLDKGGFKQNDINALQPAAKINEEHPLPFVNPETTKRSPVAPIPMPTSTPSSDTFSIPEPSNSSGTMNIPGFAAGGEFEANQTMLVGEKGPELVKFGQPGQVIPNDHQLTQSVLSDDFEKDFDNLFHKKKHSQSALLGKGGIVEKVAQKYGINPAFLASILVHESGWGESEALKKYNNPSGTMSGKGKNNTEFKMFKTIEEGIEYTAKNLKNNYIEKGRTTIESVAKKYAPVGAANDPKNLNQYWPENVQKLTNQFGGGGVIAGASAGTGTSAAVSSSAPSPSIPTKKTSGGKPARGVPEGLATIRTKSGKTVSVSSKYAANFQGFINELESTGYVIKQLGGYNYRANVNDPSKLSYHSFGAAIDINESSNPNGSTKTDLPANVGQIAAKYGIDWGMNFTRTKDPMHFSIGEVKGKRSASHNLGNIPSPSMGVGGGAMGSVMNSMPSMASIGGAASGLSGMLGSAMNTASEGMSQASEALGIPQMADRISKGENFETLMGGTLNTLKGFTGGNIDIWEGGGETAKYSYSPMWGNKKTKGSSAPVKQMAPTAAPLPALNPPVNIPPANNNVAQSEGSTPSSKESFKIEDYDLFLANACNNDSQVG
ncbi:MAG: glucosaminidase domain-containing protein [Candidatus Pacearchaeota archaeon]